MGLLSQSSHGLTIVLAPFTGVNNGTSRLLKSITAAELATLREGDVVYVSSYRDYWKWLPNSTIVGDDTLYCAPTVVGVGPGRFERLLLASPDWLLQTAWFVDNTAANEEGSGLTALNPVKTDIEIARRWGLGRQTSLTIPVVITYANSPSSESNFNILLMPGASITWYANLGAPSKIGVLTAVTPINRATQTPLDVTAVGLGATDVRKLIRITASVTPANIGAYATILKDLGAGKVRTTPFGISDVVTGFTIVSPVVGDTIEIVAPSVTMQTGSIKIDSGSNDSPIVVPRANCFVFDGLKLDGPAFGQQTITCGNTFGVLVRTELANQGFAGNLYNPIICHGGIVSSRCQLRSGGYVQLNATGLFATMGVNSGASLLMQKDTTFQSVSIALNSSAASDIQSFGTAYFDSPTIGLNIDNGARYLLSGNVADWGTANTTYGLRVRSGGQYIYTTVKPTMNAGLGVGRESLIGGTDKLYAAVPYIEPLNNAALVLSA